jgi:hypothetical protein
MSRDKTTAWVIFLRPMLGNIFAEKSIEREGKIRQNNALSLPGVGGKSGKVSHHCQIIKNIHT